MAGSFWHDTSVWRTDGQTVRQNLSWLYSALHSNLCWRAV